MLAGRIERALQKGLALDELSADKRSLPPDMRWAAMTDILSGSRYLSHKLATTRHEGALPWQRLLGVTQPSSRLRINSELQQPLVQYQHHFMQDEVGVKRYKPSCSCA